MTKVEDTSKANWGGEKEGGVGARRQVRFFFKLLIATLCLVYNA